MSFRVQHPEEVRAAFRMRSELCTLACQSLLTSVSQVSTGSVLHFLPSFGELALSASDWVMVPSSHLPHPVLPPPWHLTCWALFAKLSFISSTQ